MSQRLLLVDGQAFCYRAFYAIRNLTNSKGEPTNAIYGFITMFRKLLEEEKPEYAAVCFDRKEPTFRHQKYEKYKSERKPMPEPLVEQIPHIKEFLHASHIPTFELAGYEADDLIGTISKRAEKEGLEVVIATSDKDMFQLVDDKVHIFHMSKEKVLGEKEVSELLSGLKPKQVVDFLALVGDSSDSIPGVPGVGEKTAVELIKEFGSVDTIFKHLNRVKESRRKLLEGNELEVLAGWRSLRLRGNLVNVPEENANWAGAW